MAKVSDLKVRDAEYWLKRYEEQTRRYYRQGDLSVRELRTLFKDARNEMVKEIQSFYAKYGVIESSPVFTTLADGTKVISGTTNKLIVKPSAANKKLTQGTRLTRLNQQLDNILMQLSKDQNDYMKVTLANIVDGAYPDTIYEAYRGYGLGKRFDLLNPNIISQLIRNPVNGQSFSTRVWNNRDRLANTVNQTLNNGITQGLSNNEMARRIAKDMDSGFKVAKRLVNTEVTNSYSQSTLAGYEASGIVDEYEYVTTLDNRTSEICTELDGQIFKLSEAVTGLNYPPMHVNCRSTTTAHFGTSKQDLTRVARSLGGNTFTVPASMDAKNFRAIYVDKTLTREQWDNGKRI